MIVGCRLGGDLWFVARNGTVADRVIAKRRLLYVVGVGVLTVALSAFWVGPFLLDHQYMTDMKYGFRPSSARRLVLGHVLRPAAPLDVLVDRGWRSSGCVASIARRHVVGRRPRADRHRRRRADVRHPRQPAGHRAAVEPAGPAVLLPDALPADDGRRRRAGRCWSSTSSAQPATPASMPGIGRAHGDRGRPDRRSSCWSSFGWVYEVLPLGGHHDQDGTRCTPGAYCAGTTTRSRPTTPTSTTRRVGSGWAAYNFKGYEGADAVPRVLRRSIQTMDQIGQDVRLRPGALGDRQPQGCRQPAATARRGR